MAYPHDGTKIYNIVLFVCLFFFPQTNTYLFKMPSPLIPGVQTPNAHRWCHHNGFIMEGKFFEMLGPVEAFPRVLEFGLADQAY